MNIPDKVKIGGMIYSVEITDAISLGVNYYGEIDYSKQEIRVRPYAEDQRKAGFLHEVIHGIYDNLGYTDHDEKKVDELAHALYALIVDNPTLFGGDANANP